MEKKIICLVGLKGSGKSTIGTALQNDYGIRFIRVEHIWLELAEQAKILGQADLSEGFRRQTESLLTELGNHSVLCFESTGTTDEFIPMIEKLKKSAKVFLVRIIASPELCIKRVRSRDPSMHVNVSDMQLDEINEEAQKVSLLWDMEVNNDGTVAMTETGRRISQLLM